MQSSTRDAGSAGDGVTRFGRIRRLVAFLVLVLAVVAAGCESSSVVTTTTTLSFPPVEVPTTGPADDPWRRGAPMLIQRSEVAAAALDGYLYVAGGFLGPGRVTDSMERYDPQRDVWEQVAPLPESRHHLTLIPLGGLLYAVGGYPGDGPGFSQDVWAYDPTTDEWSSVAPLPAPRAAHAGAALDGNLYVVGGVSPVPGAAEAISIYEPSTDSWSVHPSPMPTAREHVVAVAFQDRLWVMGGRSGVNLATVEIFDPSTGAWEVGPELPVATSGHTAASIGAQIHVTGGESFELLRTLPEHQVLGAGDDEWHLGEPMPAGRHGLGSGVIDGLWYVAAGGPAIDLTVSGHLDIWSP